MRCNENTNIRFQNVVYAYKRIQLLPSQYEALAQSEYENSIAAEYLGYDEDKTCTIPMYMTETQRAL